MKVAETKTVSTSAKSNTPFFQKGIRQGLSFSAENEHPFFQKKVNDFPIIQSKLNIGKPNDKYEVEADAVADKVIQRLSNKNSIQQNNHVENIQAKPTDFITPISNFIQKKCASCEQEEKLQKKENDDDLMKGTLQKKPIFESNAAPPPPPVDEDNNVQRKCEACKEEEKNVQPKSEGNSFTASSSIENSLLASKGSGTPMSTAVQSEMESSFGIDFSSVRIHNNSSAIQMSKDLNAQAFTHGNDIYFNEGKYDTASTTGKHLLAHELTHTVQQGNGISLNIQKSSPTRGAGGCGPPRSIDEDNNGARGAGSTAHRQIQSYLLTSGVLGELPIPRATKQQMDVTGCQPSGTEEGFEDLFKLGINVGIAEIKPYPGFNAVAENDHYIRRANQSKSRLSGLGECLGTPAGDDDRAFATRLGVTTNNLPQFNKLSGILTNDTIIGSFTGDPTRTLKARLIAPGAVGYWCTGTATDTYICGSSQNETNEYIDRVLLPAQDLVDEFIRQNIEIPLDDLIANFSTDAALSSGQGVGGNFFATQIQLINQMLPPGVTIQDLTNIVLREINPYARGILLTLLRQFKSRLINELRLAIRNALRQMIQDALAALCVGLPVVTFVQLMDELQKRIKQMSQQLIPVLATVIMVQLAQQAMMAFLRILGLAILQIARSLREFLSWFAELLIDFLIIIAKILAVLFIALMIVGVIVLAIITIAAALDPVPGDEIAIGAATAALARLIPVVWSFVVNGPVTQAH